MRATLLPAFALLLPWCAAQDWNTPATAVAAVCEAKSDLFALEVGREQSAMGMVGSLRCFPLGRPETARDRASELLWEEFPGDVSPAMAFSCAKGRDGSWVAATTFHKGGGRGLRYWTGSSSPFEPATNRAVGVRRIFKVTTVESKDATIDPAAISDDAPLLDDVFDPQVLEWRGKFHVIANGWGRRAWGMDWHRGSHIWTAPLPSGSEAPGLESRPRVHALVGRTIAWGVDPRVVRLGDSHVLVTRQISEVLPQAAPLAFLRSSDLVSWDLDPTLSPGIEAEKIYDAAVIGDRIWIATTKTNKESQSILLRWFAPETGAWIDFQTFDAGKPDRPAPPRAALWLASKGDPPLPVVVFRTQSGELKTLQ